jgi:ribulose-5-phosphate 4-epimerase/fuculose-1-phosphate aldolase
MGDLIRALDGKYAAVLLANHGPVVTGKDVCSAVHAAEELEETARLLLMLRGMPTRMLSAENVVELKSVFGC